MDTTVDIFIVWFLIMLFSAFALPLGEITKSSESDLHITLWPAITAYVRSVFSSNKKILAKK